MSKENPTPIERIERFREAYRTVIKPAITEGDYFTAWGEVGYQLWALKEEDRHEILRIHCGRRMLAAGRVLERKLEAIVIRDEKPDLDYIIEMFEGYAAQTQLTGNPNQQHPRTH